MENAYEQRYEYMGQYFLYHIYIFYNSTCVLKVVRKSSALRYLKYYNTLKLELILK